MVSGSHTQGDRGKLGGILAALEASEYKTAKYATLTFVFYVVLIAVFILLTLTAQKPDARGGNLGILILVSLGFLGMWISPLRGLKRTGTGIAGFLNLFHLPLTDRLHELQDASRWASPEDRLAAAGELLEHQGEAEKEMRAWPNRLLSLAVITAIDLLIWLAWDAWVLALINQFIATAVSQTHISLAPTPSLQMLEEDADAAPAEA